MEQTSNKTFEEYMAELDDVTKRLTQEKLTLDELVTLYERGTILTKLCMDMLKSYSGRIELLRNGAAELFECDSAENNGGTNDEF